MTVAPTTRKGRATRQQLIDAGREVFAEHGYVAATMSQVADQAGMSMGALYRYFRNKDDLFESVIHGVHNELFDLSATKEHHLGRDPYAALLEANRGYLQGYSQRRDVMRAFMEAAHVNDRFRDFWWEMRERHIVRFLGALNHVRPGDARTQRLAAEAMASLVEQSAYVWFSQAQLSESKTDVAEAAEVVTKAWHALFFSN
jgi:AcrR family transcriptional regulator